MDVCYWCRARRIGYILGICSSGRVVNNWWWRRRCFFVGITTREEEYRYKQWQNVDIAVDVEHSNSFKVKREK